MPIFDLSLFSHRSSVYVLSSGPALLFSLVLRGPMKGKMVCAVICVHRVPTWYRLAITSHRFPPVNPARHKPLWIKKTMKQSVCLAHAVNQHRLHCWSAARTRIGNVDVKQEHFSSSPFSSVWNAKNAREERVWSLIVQDLRTQNVRLAWRGARSQTLSPLQNLVRIARNVMVWQWMMNAVYHEIPYVKQPMQLLRQRQHHRQLQSPVYLCRILVRFMQLRWMQLKLARKIRTSYLHNLE